MEEYTECGYAMGTFLETRFSRRNLSVERDIRSLFERMERAASFFLPESSVSRINRAAGCFPVPAGADVLHVLDMALRAARFTEGIFDPSIGAVTGLWRIGRKEERIPSKEEEARARELVDYRRIHLSGGRVFLARKGMALDLGGIAKEETLFQAAMLAEKTGMNGIIDAGGDMALVGRKEDGSPWRVGIQHPRRRGALAAVLSLDGENMVETSGDYRRFLLRDGRFQSHVFGSIPQRGPLVSATLVYRREREHPLLYGSACLAGGLDRVAGWLDRLPGVEGIFITAGMKVYVTEGISFRVKVLAEEALKQALILHR